MCQFSKFAQIWAKMKIFEKIGWFCSKFGSKLDWLVYEWITFSWKIPLCMGLLSNSMAAHPNQIQTWVTPPPSLGLIWSLDMSSIIRTQYSHCVVLLLIILCSGPEDPSPVQEEIQYPPDVWYILSNYISPLQVGCFAAICRDAYIATTTAAFWKSLYQRYNTFLWFKGELHP